MDHPAMDCILHLMDFSTSSSLMDYRSSHRGIKEPSDRKIYLLYVFKFPSSGGIGLGVNFSVLCGGLYFLLCPGELVEGGEELLPT